MPLQHGLGDSTVSEKTPRTSHIVVVARIVAVQVAIVEVDVVPISPIRLKGPIVVADPTGTQPPHMGTPLTLLALSYHQLIPFRSSPLYNETL